MRVRECSLFLREILFMDTAKSGYQKSLTSNPPPISSFFFVVVVVVVVVIVGTAIPYHGRTCHSDFAFQANLLSCHLNTGDKSCMVIK